MPKFDIVAEIFHRFSRNGHREYGESVTQEQHALQAAHLAEQDNADDRLVAAALLHDFGHLLHGEDAAVKGIDAIHEEIGAKFACGHRFFQVDMGCCNDPDVDLDGAASP